MKTSPTKRQHEIAQSRWFIFIQSNRKVCPDYNLTVKSNSSDLDRNNELTLAEGRENLFVFTKFTNICQRKTYFLMSFTPQTLGYLPNSINTIDKIFFRELSYLKLFFFFSFNYIFSFPMYSNYFCISLCTMWISLKVIVRLFTLSLFGVTMLIT